MHTYDYILLYKFTLRPINNTMGLGRVLHSATLVNVLISHVSLQCVTVGMDLLDIAIGSCP